MSDSNRGKRPATLEAFLCILALLGFGALIYATGRTFGIDAGRDQVSARQHYEAAKQDALDACGGRQGTGAIECVTKGVESAQGQSESRQDLYAQQDMARWAFWMLVVTALTFGATAIGVWLVKRTLEATLEAVKDTGRATDAMERQNDLAKEAQRPWLHFDLGEVRQHAFLMVNSERDQLVQVFTSAILTIQNTGSSPALQVDRRTKVLKATGFSEADQVSYFADKRKWFTVENIPPGGSATMHLYESCEIMTPDGVVPDTIGTVLLISIGYRAPGSEVRNRTGQSFFVCKEVYPGGAMRMLTYDELSAPPIETGKPLGLVCATAPYRDGIMT